MKTIKLFITLLLLTTSIHAGLYNPNKTVTIYIHGFDPQGYHAQGVFGEDTQEDFFEDLPALVGLPTTMASEDINQPNVITSTTYYGDIYPAYYTQQDKDELDAIGSGIPRYAMIVAKYTKHMLQRTGAQQVNFLSGSMGALVTRWMIEKDLEGLASSKKIARWLTIEGVVNGNYAASKSLLYKLYDSLEKTSIDLDHMKYKWVESQFGKNYQIGQNPLYKDILIGHETSTDDSTKEAALTKILLSHGQFWPNDGYQVSKDTAFSDMLENSRFLGYNPTHTYLHATHLGVKDHKSLWAEISNFITSNKRVKVTLTKATIKDIKEKNKWYKKFLPAEVLFESRIYSPATNLKWGINDPIDQRLYDGGVPKIIKYAKKNETKALSQPLYDDFILPEEDTLLVQLNALEIDGDLRYKIYESLKDRNYDKLGNLEFNIPLQNGTYSFSESNLDIEVTVEVINYPFELLGETSTDTIITSENSDENILLEKGDLVTFQRVASKDSAYMEQKLKAVTTLYPTVKKDKIYGVDAYKIIYTTTDKDGNKINASGLVTLPQDINKTLNIISDQHSTIFSNHSAPSVREPLTTTSSYMTALRGYIVSMPDYIGYGKTQRHFHPYMVKESLATSVIDMLTATKQLLDIKGIVYNDGIFLTGYSEGGFATLAALEKINSTYPDINVKAAAPMAGAYDLKVTGDFILSSQSYPSPKLPVFMMHSYDEYFGLHTIDEAIQEPYKTEIQTYFANKEQGIETEALELPTQTELLYNQSFLQTYNSEEQTPLKEQLVNNSLYNWTPTMPIRLYHCEGDEIVPSSNSNIAYDNFIQNGAVEVELAITPEGSHYSCDIPFYIDAINWFDSL